MDSRHDVAAPRKMAATRLLRHYISARRCRRPAQISAADGFERRASMADITISSRVDDYALRQRQHSRFHGISARYQLFDRAVDDHLHRSLL